MKLFIAPLGLILLVAPSLDALTFKNNSNDDVNFSIALIYPKSAARDPEWLEYVYVAPGKVVEKQIPQLKLLPYMYTVTGKAGGRRVVNYVFGGKEFVCGQYGAGYGDINARTLVYEDGKCRSE